MTNQSTGELQKPRTVAPVIGGEASPGEIPLPAAEPTVMLTMSRGTRPLSTLCLANGDLHGRRRRSA